MLQKNHVIENKRVIVFKVDPEGQKKGDPKNEGKSKDVYENKGPKK
jgi:hypothetical protein